MFKENLTQCDFKIMLRCFIFCSHTKYIKLYNFYLNLKRQSNFISNFKSTSNEEYGNFRMLSEKGKCCFRNLFQCHLVFNQ